MRVKSPCLVNKFVEDGHGEKRNAKAQRRKETQIKQGARVVPYRTTRVLPQKQSKLGWLFLFFLCVRFFPFGCRLTIEQAFFVNAAHGRFDFWLAHA